MRCAGADALRAHGQRDDGSLRALVFRCRVCVCVQAAHCTGVAGSARVHEVAAGTAGERCASQLARSSVGSEPLQDM
eukprot:6995418-Pyramimonas_sp.AAC.1